MYIVLCICLISIYSSSISFLNRISTHVTVPFHVHLVLIMYLAFKTNKRHNEIHKWIHGNYSETRLKSNSIIIGPHMININNENSTWNPELICYHGCVFCSIPRFLNRRPRDWQSCALTNCASFISSRMQSINWLYSAKRAQGTPMTRRFPDKRGGGALWITLREVPYWGSAAVLPLMLAYVDLQTPPPARPATVTDDISPG